MSILASGVAGEVASGISTLITGVLDRIWPNPNEQERLKIEALRIALASEMAIHETNQAEAKHPSMFVAGWRPAVGWICAAGIAYSFVLQPLIAWAAAVSGQPAPPSLDLFHLMGLLSGMLGFGAYRTYEGRKGVKRTQWRNPDANAPSGVPTSDVT